MIGFSAFLTCSSLYFHFLFEDFRIFMQESFFSFGNGGHRFGAVMQDQGLHRASVALRNFSWL